MSQALNEPGSSVAAGPETDPGREWSIEQVRRDVAEVLYESEEEIGDDENLLDHGVDSIRLMSLVERWRRAGADVSLIELAEQPTVAGLWAVLDRKTAGR